MPLRNILANVASDLGVNLSVSSERAWLIERVNSASDDLYNHNDLKNCEREQVFEIGTTDQEIALPMYVDKVIACRDYEVQKPITRHDMRPRYMSANWRLPFLGYPYFIWREKGLSPIKREIVNAGFLTFTLPLANSKLFSVVVTGETANAKRVQEVVTFTTTDLTKSTINSWLSIESIRKSSTTDVDIAVTDIDGNELATIPNSEVLSQYKIIQVQDKYETPTQSILVEVLYKIRFTPFTNDYDSFPCGDIYDKAIEWKVLEEYYSKREGMADRAAICRARADEDLIEIARIQDAGKDVRLNFGANRVYQHFTDVGQNFVTGPTWSPAKVLSRNHA